MTKHVGKHLYSTLDKLVGPVNRSYVKARHSNLFREIIHCRRKSRHFLQTVLNSIRNYLFQGKLISRQTQATVDNNRLLQRDLRLTAGCRPNEQNHASIDCPSHFRFRDQRKKQWSRLVPKLHQQCIAARQDRVFPRQGLSNTGHRLSWSENFSDRLVQIPTW